MDTVLSRRRVGVEIVIVLAVSLGASAVYSLVNIVSRLTSEVPLGQQSAGINQAQSSREWLDFTYQFLSIVFDLAPVALVLYLLTATTRDALSQIGFDRSQPGRDIGRGLALVAIIGIPGLAFYAMGRALGFTVNIIPAPLDTYWWTVPLLILSALRAALSEELIVVAYLYERLGRLGWGKWTIILSTAALRGSYHLYQGIGPFFGNFVMGIVFGWAYTRWGRVMPLVIAHWILDIVSFVGYALVARTFPELFGVPVPTNPTPSPTPTAT